MKTEDLIEEIERNRRLSELEETPRTAHDYCSAMPDKEMTNRYIEYLINQSESKDLQIRSLEIKIDELSDKFGESSSKINELLEELKLLRKELSESQKESRSYRKKIAKLEEQQKSAKAEKYGRRHSKSKDDDNNEDISSPDRSESEEDFDGNEYLSDVEAAPVPKDSRNSSATGKTFNIANRPETYKSIGVNGRKIFISQIEAVYQKDPA